MIKFFRQIRQSLIMENKTSKYLKYAIGEIILVVIGILIALSLNNWNEKRKQEADFDKLIDALENEIIEIIDEANYEIAWAREVQSNASKILLNEISRQELLEDSNLRGLITLNRLDINSDDVRSLVNRQEDFPENYKVLIPHLKNYLKIEERYTESEIEYGEQITGYTDFLIKTQPWFSAINAVVLDSAALNKKVDFILKNPVYKNYLKSYIDGYKYSLREMIGVRSACLAILAEIKRIRGDFKADDIKELFGKYNITPYTEIACEVSEMPTGYFNEPPTYLPLFNSSNEISTIKWIDYGDNSVQEIQLKPGELKINPASKRMPENVVLEIVRNGECIVKYHAKKNGFLLVQ